MHVSNWDISLCNLFNKGQTQAQESSYEGHTLHFIQDGERVIISGRNLEFVRSAIAIQNNIPNKSDQGYGSK